MNIYRITLHSGRTFLAEGESVFSAVAAAGYGSGIWQSVKQPVELVLNGDQYIDTQDALKRVFDHYGPPAASCECFICELQRELIAKGVT